MNSTTTIGSPQQLVASIPYIVGFEPTNSLVVAFLEDGKRLRLSMRIDAPPAAPFDEVSKVISDAVQQHAEAEGIDAAVIVLWQDDRNEDTLRSLREWIGEAHYVPDSEVRVLDVLWCDSGRWGTALCNDATCCDPDGYPLERGLAAPFVEMGIAPLPNRDSVVSEIDPAGKEGAWVIPQETRSMGAKNREKLEKWRDAAISTLMEYLRGDADERTTDLRAMGTWLHDIRVRDVVLYRIAMMEQDRWRSVYERVAAICRASYKADCAPACTVAAFVIYACGDGARASIAGETALRADETYSLALLMMTSIKAGMPPRMLVAGFRKVDPVAARNGVQR